MAYIVYDFIIYNGEEISTNNKGLTTENVYVLAEKRKRFSAEVLIPQEMLWKEQLKFGFGAVPELSVFQRLRIQVFGNSFLNYIKPAGYSSAVPIFAVKCSRHDIYLDTPHGNSKYFQCHDCLVEVKTEAEKRTKTKHQQ
jgi:hypothetical protein